MRLADVDIGDEGGRRFASVAVHEMTQGRILQRKPFLMNKAEVGKMEDSGMKQIPRLVSMLISNINRRKDR